MRSDNKTERILRWIGNEGRSNTLAGAFRRTEPARGRGRRGRLAAALASALVISACADAPTEPSAAAPGEPRLGVGAGGTTLSIRAGERVMVFLEGANATGCESVALGGAVSQQVFAQVGNCAGAAAIGTRVQSQQAAADGWVSFSLPASGGGQVQVTEVPGAIQVYRVAMDDADSDSDFDDVRLRVEVHADVRDFGAIPSDYGDDRAAIQSVLDNASYRSIYFDPGTYDIHNALNVRRSGVRLWGPLNPDGSRPSRLYKVGGTVNVDSSSAVYVGRPDQVSNVVIEQLFFQGEFVANAFAVKVVYGDSIRFANNRVRNIGALITAPPGLGSHLNRYIWVEHNLVDNDPQYYKDGTFGVAIQYSEHAWVRHNQISNVAHGIQWWGGEANPIIDGYQPNVFAVREVQIDSNSVVNVSAGIWGGMGHHIKVRSNYVQHCSDVCLDAEGGADILFQNNIAKHAAVGALAVYFFATDVRFIGNHVEQTGPLGNWSSLENIPAGYPVGRMMFTVLRDEYGYTDQTPGEQTILLEGNTFHYTGSTGFGEVQKKSSLWFGVARNQFLNTILQLDYNNNGSVDVTGNRLAFTRSTGSRPPIRVGWNHLGPSFAEQGQVVIDSDTITTTVPQTVPGIEVEQVIDAPHVVMNTIVNNRVSGSFPWDVGFINKGAAHHWYINNNGGRIQQGGTTAPHLIGTPN